MVLRVRNTCSADGTVSSENCFRKLFKILNADAFPLNKLHARNGPCRYLQTCKSNKVEGETFFFNWELVK